MMNMRNRTGMKYMVPAAKTLPMDLEGVICHSMHFTVTVDELNNKNIPPDGQTAPSEIMYFEF